MNLYTPLVGHIYSAWWVYIPTTLEYTDPSANLRKLECAESTLPCSAVSFSEGMSFPLSCRYFLPSSSKLSRQHSKRLKPIVTWIFNKRVLGQCQKPDSWVFNPLFFEIRTISPMERVDLVKSEYLMAILNIDFCCCTYFCDVDFRENQLFD